jgi:hypothetical protein
MDKVTKDKQRLAESLDRHIKALQKQILDITELVVPQQNWKAVRSKLLGVTNDIRRDLTLDIELNYSITYTPKTVSEDVIEVNGSKFQGVSYKERRGNSNGEDSN